MRGVKAEGGWAVVCTEEVEIHHSHDFGHYVEGRIWEDGGHPGARPPGREGARARLAGRHRARPRGHEHRRTTGAGGRRSARRTSRRWGTTRFRRGAWHWQDIADLRRWHRAGGRPLARGRLRPRLRLRRARADHDPALPLAPLQRPHRRVRRLAREPGAAAARDPRGHPRGGRRAGCGRLPHLRRRADRRRRASSAARSRRCSAIVGELPDLWDFMVGDWDFDSITSRFAGEGAQEEYVRGLKQLTTKPVVGVGRFTSPDTMVRMIRDGVLDFIGAARPSIADPFLPEEDRGGAVRGHPRVHRLQHLRHRRRARNADPLHPEPEHGRGVAARLASRADPPEDERREGAGRRRRAGRAGGGDVARAARLRGGARRGDRRARRAGSLREARLPGLAAWIRVVDYRKSQLERLRNVEVAFGSELTAEEILSYDFDHVGDRDRRPLARRRRRPLAHEAAAARRGPDPHPGRPDGGRATRRRARRPVRRRPLLHRAACSPSCWSPKGYEVTLVTPEPRVSEWTVNTMEQARIQRRLIELGVEIHVLRTLVGTGAAGVRTACVYTGREQEHACDALVLVTARLPERRIGRGARSRTELPLACGFSAMRGRRERLRRPSGTAAATQKSWMTPRRAATSRRSSVRSWRSRRASGAGGGAAGPGRWPTGAVRRPRCDGHPGGVELPAMAETGGEPTDIVALLGKHEGDARCRSVPRDRCGRSRWT